ncbi:MAG: type VI secretion system contractile sheath large subunit, partial [Opitutaceae bacterium]|nr:type VI secretion system contractile sheath large subunit [Opitutaceae bacterium]
MSRNKERSMSAYEKSDPGPMALDHLLMLVADPAFRPGAKRVAAAADAMIAFLDEKISEQLSVILHHPEFRRLESSWRSLEFLVNRIDFRQNILLSILSVSKADLLADFDDTPDITFSGFYRHVYTAEYGQFGGHPIGAIVANYEFDASPPDLRLLSHAAAVCAMAHAPFLAGVGQKFFGLSRWADFPNL